MRHITRQDIHFVRELGEGAFGRVFLGLCKGIQPGEEHTMVAVMWLPPSAARAVLACWAQAVAVAPSTLDYRKRNYPL